VYDKLASVELSRQHLRRRSTTCRG